jgi:hypothetical protein
MSHIPPLIENSHEGPRPIQRDSCNCTEQNINQIWNVIQLIVPIVVGICILFVIPLYIFSAAFLFTQNNYKFTICCSHEKFDFDRASIDDSSLLILIVFFYIFEFIFIFSPSFVGSFLFCIRIIIISILHIIASVWLSVKVNFTSIFYIVTAILNLIIGVVHFIIYKLQKRLEEEDHIEVSA